MTIAPSDRRPELMERKQAGLTGFLFPQFGKIAASSLSAATTVYGAYCLLRLMQNPGISTPQAAWSTALLSLMLAAFLWLLYRLLALVGGSDVTRSLGLLTVPAFVLAILQSLAVKALFSGSGLVSPHSDLLGAIFVHYVVLCGWGALYLALVQGLRTEETVVRSRNLERLTRRSEQRALRFQLNPHFVFNALNSISSLVVDEKNHQAEELVDNLADYMRSVLADDGKTIVTLDEEIAQQIRYLQIEQVRFPDRLLISQDIDPSAREWKLPALIIQPLVENTIKHGVAKSSKPVRVEISAHLEAGRLRVEVVNDGQIDSAAGASEIVPGTGTGLANIRERLAAVYGPAAALIVANRDDGMVASTVVIPDESHIFRNR